MDFFFPDLPPTTQACKVVCANCQNFIAQNEAAGLGVLFFCFVCFDVFEEATLRESSNLERNQYFSAVYMIMYLVRRSLKENCSDSKC